MDWLDWWVADNPRHGEGVVDVEGLYIAFRDRLLSELHAETEHGDEVIINRCADDMERT